MASGMFEDFAEDILDHFIAGTAKSASTQADVRVAFTTGTASKTSIGAGEIVEGGYTAGGQALNTGAALIANNDSGVAVITNDEALTWTETDTDAPWTTITNIILHRGGATCSAANGLYYINGLSITLPASATLTIPAGNLKFQIG